VITLNYAGRYNRNCANKNTLARIIGISKQVVKTPKKSTALWSLRLVLKTVIASVVGEKFSKQNK